jgi:hypothetical protein
MKTEPGFMPLADAGAPAKIDSLALVATLVAAAVGLRAR